jgi:hypothetical protein
MHQQTIEKLHTLHLDAMADAFREQLDQPKLMAMPFEERFALLVDRQHAAALNAALAQRLRRAGMRQDACLENLDLRTPRGLDRSTMQTLATGQWIRQHLNILLSGKTGIGKSWLACALGNRAARDGFSVLYKRLSRSLIALDLSSGFFSFPYVGGRVAAGCRVLSAVGAQGPPHNGQTRVWAFQCLLRGFASDRNARSGIARAHVPGRDVSMPGKGGRRTESEVITPVRLRMSNFHAAFAATAPASKFLPVFHMMWRMTASLRATATAARLRPLFFRSERPQERSELFLRTRVRMITADP